MAGAKCTSLPPRFPPVHALLASDSIYLYYAHVLPLRHWRWLNFLTVIDVNFHFKAIYINVATSNYILYISRPTLFSLSCSTRFSPSISGAFDLSLAATCSRANRSPCTARNVPMHNARAFASVCLCVRERNKLIKSNAQLFQ